MITTNMKGQLAVSKAEIRAIELGFIPSRPLYDTRYDLIVDNGNKLIRAQIKYGGGKSSNSSGSAVVKLDYETRTKKVYTYNNSEVDALIVYLPQIDKLCFLPKKVFLGKRKLNIRIEKPKNNQVKGVIAAEDYYW
ncbi:MAG TPA: group I intron-associated PD-(D/E)XK endonuclease [Patescibacteria group bacterium]|nr:group I intron-associated PD-(D/E)XK endonuclease [Patescibacteria group bacterium]